MIYSAEWPGNHGPDGAAYFVPSDAVRPEPGDKGFAATSLTRDVRSLGSGEFLLFDDPYAVISQDNDTSAHFTEVPEFALSRQRSAQEVTFGQLVVSSESEREAVEHVAIKPYNLPRGAVQEAGALHVVNNLSPSNGRPLSFEPLGFYRFPDGKQTGLITRYDPSVLTQDNLFWDPNRTPTVPEVRRAFHHAAVALGALHGRALAHRDAQVKNIARDNQGVRIVDLTDLRQMMPENAKEDVVDDIGKYTASLTHVDGQEGTTFERDYTRVFVDTFVPTYLKRLEGSNGALPLNGRLTGEEIEAIAESSRRLSA